MRYDITNIAIEDYLHALMPPRAPELAALEEAARARGLSLVGPVQGQFLYLITLLTKARDVLEIGLTTGYAALWMLRALEQTNGRLVGIESRPERAQLARDLLEQAGVYDRLQLLEGHWSDLLPTLNESFDMIFLDTLRSVNNDQDAVRSLDLCVPLLRPGGLLITDNVLVSAQVLEEDAPPTVRGVQRFNEAIMQHAELESVILPLRDGVALSRKRSS